MLAVTSFNTDELVKLQENPDTGSLYCINKDQYGRDIGHPFCVFVEKNLSKDQVREAIIEKLLKIRI